MNIMTQVLSVILFQAGYSIARKPVPWLPNRPYLIQGSGWSRRLSWQEVKPLLQNWEPCEPMDNGRVSFFESEVDKALSMPAIAKAKHRPTYDGSLDPWLDDVRAGAVGMVAENLDYFSAYAQTWGLN